MEGLLDEYYICPGCTSPEYFPWMEKLVKDRKIDYAFVQPEAEIVEWGDYYERNGKFPCLVFMGCKRLSESLRDKSIMAELLEGTDYIPKTIKVTQDNPRFEDVKKEIGFAMLIQKLLALHQPLLVRINRPDVGQLCPRQSEQRVLYANDLLPDDVIVVFHQQIIDLTDKSRRRIFDRQHGKIRHAGNF